MVFFTSRRHSKKRNELCISLIDSFDYGNILYVIHANILQMYCNYKCENKKVRLVRKYDLRASTFIKIKRADISVFKGTKQFALVAN